jgi:cytochrome c-type biogenesis protein CcmH/NrfG
VLARVVLAVSLALGTAHAQRPGQGDDESAALVDEGRAALKQGKLDDAAKALDQALALNPRRVEAYVLRSAVYAARKQYKDGIALMRKAQLLAGSDTEVLTALGTQLVLSGDTAEGVPLLEQVVAKEPARYDAQLLLGQHWHDAGNYAESIGAYEAYFAHRPQQLEGRVAAPRDRAPIAVATRGRRCVEARRDRPVTGSHVSGGAFAGSADRRRSVDARLGRQVSR